MVKLGDYLIFEGIKPEDIKKLIREFDGCEVSSNKAFVQGSLDFCSLLIEKEDLGMAAKLMLHGSIRMFIDDVFTLRVMITNDLNILTNLT
jgi:hypothetical protein